MIRSENQLFCIHFLYNQPHLTAKRASSCISTGHKKPPKRKGKKGSIAIETAMLLPFFFLAVVCLIYMMEVMVIRTSIRGAMQYTAKITAEEAYLKSMITPVKLEEQIVNVIGTERLDRSVVVGGSQGLKCNESRMSLLSGILEIRVQYEVKVPVPTISTITIPMEESMKVKGWCGYTKNGWQNGVEDTVYITESGMVYHRDYSCNYLELSIRSIASESLETVRNQNQGIYGACEVCVHGEQKEQVFVTDYGERYHNSLNCSGLKRTVYAVPLSEAVGKGVCAKCGR